MHDHVLTSDLLPKTGAISLFAVGLPPSSQPIHPNHAHTRVYVLLITEEAQKTEEEVASPGQMNRLGALPPLRSQVPHTLSARRCYCFDMTWLEIEGLHMNPPALGKTRLLPEIRVHCRSKYCSADIRVWTFKLSFVERSSVGDAVAISDREFGRQRTSTSTSRTRTSKQHI